jgi:hypothetical protein
LPGEFELADASATATGAASAADAGSGVGAASAKDAATGFGPTGNAGGGGIGGATIGPGGVAVVFACTLAPSEVSLSVSFSRSAVVVARVGGGGTVARFG